MKRRLIWRKRDPSGVNKVVLEFTQGESRNQDNAEFEPIEFYKRLMNNELLDKIVDESNKYVIQTNPSSPLNYTRNELEQFFGILYVISLVKMPSTRLYWSTEFNYDKVASIMTVSRLEKIKNFLHCNDNLSRPKNCSDRLCKIQPVVDHLKNSFAKIALSEKLCIDEQMVPFKGKSGLKQYNPQKLKKWGYNLYVLSGIDGLIHNFEIHTGAIQPCPNQPDLKASGNIVLTLLQNVPHFKWHKLYFDNWYTSVDLVKHLHNQGIACVGTVCANRLPNCKMAPDAAMKKKGGGTIELWTSDYADVDLRAIKWFDN